MRIITDRQLLIGVLVCSVLLVQSAFGEDIDAARKINDAVCIFIYLVELTVGAIASIVIIFMGLRYLSSGDNSDARYVARIGIIGAFVGIVIVVIAVPVVNIVASGFIGTVECGFFPSISGGENPASDGSVTPNVVSGQANSADIVPNGFFMTKNLNEVQDGEFPLYFELSNIGSENSIGFTDTVSMTVGVDEYSVLCNVPSMGLPADGKKLIYQCNADMGRIKQLVSEGKSVTLTLTADSGKQVTESNEDNNIFSQDVSQIPVKPVDNNRMGPRGGLTVNNVGWRE
jgi:hypothetical protein